MPDHTPGPWLITRANRSPCFIVSSSNTGLALAKVYLTDAETHRRDAEHLANARLIATAPDFRAACELLVQGKHIDAEVLAASAFIAERVKL